MRNTISRAMIAGIAALSLTGSLFVTTEPATAAGFWHGGGGFHGGGWHGGGWHGGGWHGGGGWMAAAGMAGVAGGARPWSEAWLRAPCSPPPTTAAMAMEIVAPPTRPCMTPMATISASSW